MVIVTVFATMQSKMKTLNHLLEVVVEASLTICGLISGVEDVVVVDSSHEVSSASRTVDASITTSFNLAAFYLRERLRVRVRSWLSGRERQSRENQCV